MGRAWTHLGTRGHAARRPLPALLRAHHKPSGRQCIGVAASPTASGPFASTATEPLVCQTHPGGSIDPHPFIDTEGTAFLLWKADGNAIGQPSTLFAQRLTPDGLALAG